MFAVIAACLMMVGGSFAHLSLEGVDPNTLSCDPAGQIFLLLPHFTDCDKFYMCTHGKEVEFSCNGGLIFDFILQVCNWERDTQCWLRSREDEIEVEGSGSGEESGDFEWFEYDSVPEAGNEDKISDIMEELKKPESKPDQHFNAILDCSRADTAVKQVPYKGDCQRFWRCRYGVPQSSYCTDGLFFNPATQQCDFEANVKCQIEQEDELQGEFIVYN